MELRAHKITKKFGGVVANKEVDLVVNEGETVGLIGPNGAGKTTLFNCIAGAFKPTSGEIYLNDANITPLPAYRICTMGLARTFQVVQTFRKMTVLENVMAGAFCRTKNLLKARCKAEEVLEFTGLIDKKNLLGSELTIADMKRVEISRALATDPQILLLDENMAGLNPVEIEQAVELVLSLKKRGLSMLVVEHVMEALLPIADRLVVLDAGVIISEGAPEEVMNNEKVIEAYLGEVYHAKRKKH